MTNFHANSWAMGLVKTLNDTKNHIISSDMAVVINDKFPKAQQHYLVLPKEDIQLIYFEPAAVRRLYWYTLQPAHLPLLEELHLLALNVIEVKRGQLEQFKIGFHAQPSMQRLHLHVISRDFVSDCLKTKKHWTSFNTALFLPYEDLCAELEANGCVKHLSKDEIQRQLGAALQCNQCNFIAKNMPNLKQHLLEHWTTQQTA